MAPGRVDSPPRSMMSAPSAIMLRARAMASSGLKYWPPSEKESGVTLTMPMTRVCFISRTPIVEVIGGRVRRSGGVRGKGRVF